MTTQAVETPTHQDGTLMQYEMLYAGQTRRVYADTENALIDVLIPEYLTMTQQQQWEHRISYMTRAQVLAQAELNLNPTFETLTVEQQTILQGPRHNQPVVPEWDCPIPLILISSYYQPSGPNPRPVRNQGMTPNIIWLDPSDDISFLISLHDIGVITLNTSKISYNFN